MNANHGIEGSSDRQLPEWLHQNRLSIAYTTYQTSRLSLLGTSPDGQRLSGFERVVDR